MKSAMKEIVRSTNELLDFFSIVLLMEELSGIKKGKRIGKETGCGEGFNRDEIFKVR